MLRPIRVERSRSRISPTSLCFGEIIVEIKAVSELTDDHRAQVHNYLKATGYRLGLLVNFGATRRPALRTHCSLIGPEF